MRHAKTQIAIRERSILEILDLALHIFRDYFVQVAAAFVLGTIPFIILNHILFGWMSEVEYGVAFPFAFVWTSILMITLEAQAASVFVCAFLGKAVFETQPQFLDVCKLVIQTWWRQFLYGWLLRGVALGLILVAFIERGDPTNNYIISAWLPLLVVYSLAVRVFRPFINEIIVLERNPVRSGQSEQMTIGRRSAMLHNPDSGTIFGRGIVIMLVGILLTLVIVGGFMVIAGVFLHDWRQGPIMVRYAYPAAMWSAVAFTTVVRFLCYLDARIRQEGWEVEILIRSEAAALTSRMI